MSSDSSHGEIELVDVANDVLVRDESETVVAVGNTSVFRLDDMVVRFDEVKSVHTLSLCPAPQYSSCEPEQTMLHCAESTTDVVIVLPQ